MGYISDKILFRKKPVNCVVYGTGNVKVEFTLLEIQSRKVGYDICLREYGFFFFFGQGHLLIGIFV